MESQINVGRVSGVYGVRGWLRIRSDCDPADGLLDYSPWQLRLDGAWQSFGLESGRSHGTGLVAKLAGVDDRDRAKGLVGADIAVARSLLPALPADEYYWSDLVGLGVVTRAGQSLGRVTGLMETGANDVLVVAGERERLIPFIAGQVILRVDAEAGRIEVDWDPEF